MTIDHLQNALSQYQQWLADAQLRLALANAELEALKATPDD